MFSSCFFIIDGSSTDYKALRVNALQKAAPYKNFFVALTYICKSRLFMKL